MPPPQTQDMEGVLGRFEDERAALLARLDGIVSENTGLRQQLAAAGTAAADAGAELGALRDAAARREGTLLQVGGAVGVGP
jgi:hypothetical protein